MSDIFKIFEVLPDQYLILSPDLIILTANKAYEKSSGKSREEIQGKHIFTVFPENPDNLEANSLSPLRDSLQKVLLSRKPHTTAQLRYDLPRPQVQGGGMETKYWQVINTPVFNEQGELKYIIHKGIDITEQVITAQQLEESRKKEQAALTQAENQRRQLYNLFMQAPALICILEGPRHVFTLVNPPYQALVGNRPLLGKPIDEAMPELNGQPIFSLLDNVYNTGESFHANEMLVQLNYTNEGKLGEKYYNFIYQATRNTEGEINGILVFAYEVTVLVQARNGMEALNKQLQEANDEITVSHEELNAANEELITSNEELSRIQQELVRFNEELEGRVAMRTKELSDINRQLEDTLANLNEKNFELDQFVYKTSHDLRAPLSTILGLITILKAEQSEEAKAQYISLMENRVHKLDKFIKSMLDYSRNTRTATIYTPVKFKTLLDECLEELEQMKHFSRIKLNLYIDKDEYHSDAFRLKIIFSNLISNAIKYQDFNKPESYLTVRVTFTGREVRIVFEDNGVGISEEHQDKLFDMFFRASHQSEGSGLGLYIVKQAVAMLKGEIRLESTVGEGSRFLITLPQTQASK